MAGWKYDVQYRNGLEETVGGFDTREAARANRAKMKAYRVTGTDYDVVATTEPVKAKARPANR